MGTASHDQLTYPARQPPAFLAALYWLSEERRWSTSTNIDADIQAAADRLHERPDAPLVQHYFVLDRPVGKPIAT
jgi:hypothetical protein